MDKPNETVEVPRSLLIDCEELLVVLTKNAAHCFGVDFGKLNTSLIELSKVTGAKK
jgi:hypothetical protein